VSKVWSTIKHEFYEVLPPTIFFFISFHIVLLDRALMAREYGLKPTSMVAATVGALLVAKVVLIVDKLPIVNRFPEKPLIYNVVWKTIIYVAASLLLHYLEHLLPLWWHMGSFAAANAHLGKEIVWPHFWAVQLWLIVLIFVYCSLRELVRVIGRDRVAQVFFRAPAARTPAGH
jgi:hypothetical protein